MKNTLTLILFTFVVLLVDSAMAQAPIVLHDASDQYLTVTEIQPIRKSALEKPNSQKHNFAATKPIAKKPKTTTQQTNLPSKPSSMKKNYKPQMSAIKTVTRPAVKTHVNVPPRSLSSSKTVIRTVSKPVYVAPVIRNIKYPAQTVTSPAKRKPVIVIDPGHGGKDPGASGKLGTREKDITLSFSLALKRALEKTGRYKVVLTRYDDRFIELDQRVKIARRSGGDVLISIHADSHPNKNTKGFSVYTLSNQRAGREAQKLLAKAEREEVIRGANLKGESKDVKEAIIDFAQGSTKSVSDDFSETLGRHLGRRIQALKRHNREGSLAVLTGADIPSVLIELGYLSNIEEERLLKRDDHKQKIVTSITNAVNEYFSKFNMVF